MHQLEDTHLPRLEAIGYVEVRRAACFEGPMASSLALFRCWFISSGAFVSPDGLQRAKQTQVELHGTWEYSLSSTAVTNIYCETSSLLSTGWIQISPPFHLPSRCGGSSFHLLGLELNRWGLSLPTQAGNQPRQSPSFA